jgi:hypothetical protein
MFTPDNTLASLPATHAESDYSHPPHVDLQRAGSFIAQVAEEGYGAKRSCALTSQLNALVATGVIDQTMALEVQEELVDNSSYDHLWSPPMVGPKREWRAWWANAGELASILDAKYNLETPRPLDIPKCLPRDLRGGIDLVHHVDAHLQTGGVAYIAGRSAVAAHARIAFVPDGHEGKDKIFVHDPHYPATTDFYNRSELARFQTGQRTILYSLDAHQQRDS